MKNMKKHAHLLDAKAKLIHLIRWEWLQKGDFPLSLLYWLTAGKSGPVRLPLLQFIKVLTPLLQDLRQ